jgi:N-acyl homoserine lactone hydrolase
MKVHALTTGMMRLKQAFLFASDGWRRQLDLFLPGAWSSPVPVHCWAIEHADRLLVVDTGETAAVHDIPFARFEVTPEQELSGALAAAGLALGDVDTVVLTHMHATTWMARSAFAAQCSSTTGNLRSRVRGVPA